MFCVDDFVYFYGGICARIAWAYFLLKAALTDVGSNTEMLSFVNVAWKRGASLCYGALEGRDSLFQG
jgi:hypothetical protein